MLDKAYSACLRSALPAVARRFTSNADAYAYLSESIADWPDQRALAGRLQEAGWSEVAWRNLSMGAVALHRGVRRR